MTESVEPEGLDRRDVLALKTILSTDPELFVDAAGEPRIGLPMAAAPSVRAPWSLRHPRVKAEIADLVYNANRIVPFEQEITRILTVLEGQAWKDYRLDVKLEQALDDEPLVEALYILLHQPEFNGAFDKSCSKLLHELTKVARKTGVDMRSNAWPKGAAQLSRRLGQLELLLGTCGITVERKRQSGGVRSVIIKSTFGSGGVESTSSPATPASKSRPVTTLPPTDAGDAMRHAVFDRIALPPNERTVE